ncbi:MAG: YjfB family protein [Verrucomicrobiales bacterium]|nr:YjfB family protein [Verrucomicrobiales bacterium]
MGSSVTTLLDSALHAETARQQSDVALLRKAQDLVKQQGEAMVQVLEQAGNPPPVDRLDTYA